MRLSTLGLAAVFAFLPGAAPAPQAIPLFDGKSLAGWEQGDRDSYRVEDGAIVGGQLQHPIDRKTFLCTTKDYGDFRLTARFKLDGNQYANTGIQIRTSRVDLTSATAVSGYQADAGYIYWGTLYDEGRRKKTMVDFDQSKVARHFNDGAWNDYEIVARGRHLTFRLNGVTTVDYEEADATIPQTGKVCLQLHNGGPMRVAFKDILLTPL